MADIFLSYASRDRERAQAVATGLEAEGLSVFWDRELTSGEKYREHIEKEMQSARVALVLWSEHSLQSAWVVDEADFARKAGKLIPVLIDDVRPPLGFAQVQSLRLTDWRGDRSAPDWRRLIETLRSTALRSSAPEADRRQMQTRKSRAPARQDYDSSRGAVTETAEETGTEILVAPDRAYNKPWGAGSTAVFIAHASGDKPRVKPIIEVLARSGFSIWIDKPHLLGLQPKLAKRVRGIEFGAGDWKEQIRKAANRANIVLAFWSDDAVDARREQFYYEVYMGLIQRKLCQARIDNIAPAKIGMPFTFDQIADLSSFTAGVYHPELDFMMAGLPRFRRRML